MLTRVHCAALLHVSYVPCSAAIAACELGGAVVQQQLALPQPMAALHALRELYLEQCPFLHIDEAKLQAELPNCSIHYSS